VDGAATGGYGHSHADVHQITLCKHIDTHSQVTSGYYGYGRPTVDRYGCLIVDPCRDYPDLLRGG